MTCNTASLASLALAACALPVLAVEQAGEGTERKDAGQLERQLATLRESYALARTDADEARQQLRDIRARLEALGGAGLGESEERIIDTTAQLEASRKENEQLRQSSLRLTAAITAYMRGALVEDAQALMALEAALRDMDVALGLRLAPQSALQGTVEESQVLSIDSESGLIVINAGREAKVEVGMPMEITRGDQAIALAVVTDVRKTVAGMLVQKHLNPALVVQVGDRVSVRSTD